MIKPEIVHVHFLLLRYKLKDRLRYLVSYLHLVLFSGQISGFTKYCLYFNTENWLRWVWDSIAIWSKILLKSPPLPFPTTTFSSSTLPCKTKVGQKSILAVGQSDGVSHHRQRRRGRRRSWSKWSHPEGNFGDGRQQRSPTNQNRTLESNKDFEELNEDVLCSHICEEQASN